MPSLTVELVPSPLWWTSNIRSIVSKDSWDRLRKEAYRRASYKCEICGGKGLKWPVEAHELWRYDDAKLVQSLVRLIALCPACHEVKHFGRTKIIGREVEATKHLAFVNRWSSDQIASHLGDAFSLWRKRSAQKGWALVVDWDAISKTYGVPLEYHGTITYPARSQ